MRSFDRRYVVHEAKRNHCVGVFDEPRGYWDSLTLDFTEPGRPIVRSNPSAFRNGEDHPVRITHVVFAPQARDATDQVLDPNGLGLAVLSTEIRLVGKDTQFQRNFFGLTGFATEVVGTRETIAQGSASWLFERPFFLSTRDALDVRAELVAGFPLDPVAVVPCSVTFSGVGVVSKRPYQFGQRHTLPSREDFDAALFRNDGGEPVLVTDLGVTLNGESTGQADASNLINRLKLGVRQIGNGTGQDWFVNGNGDHLIPAALLSAYSGWGIVHRFEGDGLLWEPGQGFSVEARASEFTQGEGITMDVGMFGYAAVQ